MKTKAPHGGTNWPAGSALPVPRKKTRRPGRVTREARKLARTVGQVERKIARGAMSGIMGPAIPGAVNLTVPSRATCCAAHATGDKRGECDRAEPGERVTGARRIGSVRGEADRGGFDLPVRDTGGETGFSRVPSHREILAPGQADPDLRAGRKLLRSIWNAPR